MCLIVKIIEFFSKFHCQHYELIFKYNVGLKTLLQQGLLEPFYCDLFCKFQTIVVRMTF